MKFIITLSLLVPMAHAADCFVVSTCIKNVSDCSLSQGQAKYSSFLSSISREARFRYEWKQNVECVNRNGKKTMVTQDGSDLMNSNATVKVEELRIPATLEEVPSEYISRVNAKALAKCEELKQTTILENRICE